MLEAILLGGGVVLGALVGRWWALLAVIPLAAWIAVVAEVEVPGWFLGAVYALIAAVGIALGVAFRRWRWR